jgi:cbb3-type cytochrome oxidase maturation protein
VSISYLLVSLGLLTFVIAIGAMFWAIDSGQYDDAESHGRAILDDEPAEPASPSVEP